nr:biofilm development regulator YmgB/AriR family protein [uncultured Enterobacter sp.]
MFQKSDTYTHFPDTSLSDYLRNAGDMLADESALLGQVMRRIQAAEGHVTNKAIILCLIDLLETTHDVVTSDIIRKALEVVVDHTLDDL